MQEHIGVVVIVLDETKTKLLMGKRKNAYLAGYFGLPGGRIEHEEPLQQTVRRELREETGLEAKEVKYLGVVRDHQKTHNFVHFVYLCISYQGTAENKEPEKCEGWLWCELTRLPKVIVPGHREAINIFQNPQSQTLREVF